MIAEQQETALPVAWYKVDYAPGGITSQPYRRWGHTKENTVSTNDEPCSLCHVNHHEPGAPKCKAIVSADDTRIPLDDPKVKEVLFDLERRVTRSDLDNSERSLRLRGLTQEWARRIRCDRGCVCDPPIGCAWGMWFRVLDDHGLPVRPVLALLADIGVFGTAWSIPARDRVFEERGWR